MAWHKTRYQFFFGNRVYNDVIGCGEHENRGLSFSARRALSIDIDFTGFYAF